jgi:hypothetical protein
MNFGTATEARIPMITMTMISSTSVNPDPDRMYLFIFSPNLLLILK